ncbi:MAG: hypothetical protein R3356_03030 [Eudoraea sp.]|nr:hypothetical protein [Eudoraea sp.]
MGLRRKYIKDRMDRRLRWMNMTLLIIIAIKLAIVLYDAFVFKTPLYYIGFFIGGYMLGGIFRRTAIVQFNVESDSFELTTSIVYSILSLSLLILRYAFGKNLLEELHVVYASDAIYLFLIGMYYSKWRMLLKKIDAVIYEFAEKKLDEKNESRGAP